MLFLLLVQHTNGEILYANGFSVDSCKAEVIQAKLAELPAVPRGMRMEYVCTEPGPTKTIVDNE